MGLATTLTDTQECPLLFEQRVLLNVRYWHRYVADRTGDVIALGRERERILRAISFGLDLNTNWPDVFKLIQAYTHHMEIRGHWESWGQLLNRALTTAEEAGDINAVITLSVLLARLAQRRGQPRQITSHYRRALRLARQTGNQYEEARACTNLGYFFTEQGRWQRAEALCCHALNLFEQLDNDHGRAHTHNHLGLLYTWQAQWDKARNHLERAWDIWQSMGDQHGLLYATINLGLLFNEQENPAQAICWFEEALELAKLTGEEAFLGKIYLNMGVSYRLNSEPTQAEACARQAEKIFRRFSNLRELANAWNNLGLAYLDQKKWTQARHYLDTSLKTRRKLKYQLGEFRSLVNLIEYDLARGNPRQAIIRVQQVEPHIKQHRHLELFHHLQSLLAKYRYVLTE